MSAPDIKPHDPDICTYCKELGLTKDDWTKAMGGNRDDGHDGHVPQLDGLLADCPGCAPGETS